MLGFTVKEGQVGERGTTERIIRQILLATLAVGVVGTAIELVLLEHYESWNQWIPLGLLGCAALVLVWHGIDRGPAPVHTLQILMLVFVLAGMLGVYLHYSGNREFELEMYPTISGMELFRKTMMGATPALAPGTMIQLALVGLAYTFRHPRLG